MDTPLIVVDMQPIWVASNQIINSCLQEIIQANKQLNPVYFLEFEFPGLISKLSIKTHDVLWKAAIKKTKFGKLEKDGSPILIKHFIKKYGSIPPLRVCGVNTEQCVYSTVFGLNQQTRNTIVVPIDACASDTNHHLGIKLLSTLSKVVVL